MKKILAAMLLSAGMATGAQAVTVDFAGGSGGDAVISGKTAEFNVGGVSGDIEAFSTYNDSNTSVISTYWDAGLGVRNGPNDVASGSLIHGEQLDGTNFSDWLTFTFDTAVELVSVTLSYLSTNDSAHIRLNGGAWVETTSAFNAFGNVLVNSFSVRAFGEDDEFVVSGFTVAPVPLPASSLLLLGGLAGFGLMRRRKKIS